MAEREHIGDGGPGDGLPLSALNDLNRWVTWRNEQRKGKVTKVPYSPRTGHRAKADDPTTWATRAEAEAAVPRLVNGTGGGIGLELGVVGEDLAIGGVDLDTCRAPDGTLADWAAEVVERLGSYAEVSPSGTGVKLFFTFKTSTLDSLRDAMGKKPGEGSGRKWARGKGEHVPSIELYLGDRYFTITEQPLAASLPELHEVPTDVLLRLIREAGPAFAGNGAAKPAPRGTDSSRSAVAFRKGVALRAAGRSYDEMVEALRSDPETADWCREKGEANGGRELQRIWEKAARHDWQAHCQCDREGNLRSNLANALVALRVRGAKAGALASVRRSALGF